MYITLKLYSKLTSELEFTGTVKKGCGARQRSSKYYPGTGIIVTIIHIHQSGATRGRSAVGEKCALQQEHFARVPRFLHPAPVELAPFRVQAFEMAKSSANKRPIVGGPVVKPARAKKAREKDAPEKGPADGAPSGSDSELTVSVNRPRAHGALLF